MTAVDRGTLVFFDDRHFTVNGSKRTMLAIATAASEKGREVLVVSTSEGVFLEYARALGLPTRTIELPAELDGYGGSLLEGSRRERAIALGRVSKRLADLCVESGARSVMVNSIRSTLYCSMLPFRGIPVVWYLQIAQNYGRLSTVAGLIPTAMPMISPAVSISAGLDPSRGHQIVPLGVDLLPFSSAASSYVAEAAGTEVLSLGSIEPRKGHLESIQAVSGAQTALGRPIRLSIAGERPSHHDNSYLEVLKKAASELSVEVSFLGQQANVAGLLASTSLLLHSAFVEGVPRVLIESQAVGVPIVATSAGGTSEVVIPGKTGWLCDVGDVDALTSAIVERFEFPDHAAAMALAGVERVQRHRLDAMQSGLLDILETVHDGPLHMMGRFARRARPGRK